MKEVGPKCMYQIYIDIKARRAVLRGNIPLQQEHDLKSPIMFWKNINPLLQSWADHHVDMPEDGGANVPQYELIKDLPPIHKQLVLWVLVRVGIYPKSASEKKRSSSQSKMF